MSNIPGSGKPPRVSPMNPLQITGFDNGEYSDESTARILGKCAPFGPAYRSSQFSSALARFGPWSDTSMDAATAKKKKMM